MEEVWKDIDGYKGKYQISNLGRVKSLSRKMQNGTRWKISKEKILKLKTKLRYKEYCKISLYDGQGMKTRKEFLVHRLVAFTFLSNPNKKKYVNHKDGNKLNNNVNNLEFCTIKENNQHARETGLSYTKYGKKDIIMIRLIDKIKKYTHKEIASFFGMHRSTVSYILKGKLRKYN